MLEKDLRQNVVNIAKGWLGYDEKSGKHKKIIDIYNNHKPLAVGYKVKYTDAWCATYVSAVMIRAGLTDIAPTECSCRRMIDLYKKKGRWMEKDNYTPSPGDVVMYDWEDGGVGDNTGNPDHVGIVVSVSGGYIQVIEGNFDNKVGYRYLKPNGRYIRGYCLPNYASKATKEVAMTTVKLPVLTQGCTGEAVKSLQQLLTAKGFDTKGIDGSFGPNTKAAFEKWQKHAGLKVDGSCGPASWTAILGA